MRIGIVSQDFRPQDREAFRLAALRNRIEVKFLDQSALTLVIKGGGVMLLDDEMKPVSFDGMINWEPYPVFEELEGVCQALDIPFINSVEAVRTARNKMLTTLKLHEHGLPQPDTLYHAGFQMSGAVIEQFGLPVVIKPKTGTQGRGIQKIDSPAKLQQITEARFRKAGLYMQRFITSEGWDLRIVVVGSQVLGAVKRTAATGEWMTPVMHGGKADVYPVDKPLERLSLLAAKALGLHFAGIDVIVSKSDGNYRILEVNAVPGLRVFQETTGISIADAVIKLMIKRVEGKGG